LFKSRTNGLNALIFGMEHPWGKKIQFCSNKVPWVTNDHALRGHSFYIGFYSKKKKIGGETR